jgi:ribosome modulation factor
MVALEREKGEKVFHARFFTIEEQDHWIGGWRP